MSKDNRYAPPTAEVADVAAGMAAPALWNPSAAASWSLLFSPILGSYLHARNWEALGEQEKATASWKWMIGSIAFFVVVVLAGIVAPDSKAADGISRLAGFALLIAWYYVLGKSQQTYVAARFGKNYPRRGWLKPLSVAFGALLALFVVLAILGYVIQEFSVAA